ncbi:hypothetical protein ASD83_05220 [Devosia sp. Root685]|uniref:hypothetical protein n=1 Tax=Devosia sp. Root685 TaxID=1736587 RepID=UPI0006F90EB9|nr:hypothetical protein [Devosia sp. Root685]KRA99889.1 hypothetical protein ASD83_05220 [Devosia sp. Root685]
MTIDTGTADISSLQDVLGAMQSAKYHRNLRQLMGRMPFETPQLKLVQASIHRLHLEAGAVLNEGDEWGEGNRKPSRGVIIVGDNGASKSYSIQYALASLPPITLKGGGRHPPNPLYWEASNGEARAWLRDLLAKLGYPTTRMPSPELAMPQIAARLRGQKLTMLGCDEISRVLNPRNFPGRSKLAAQAEIVWTQIIQMISDPVWPTPIVAAGTMELVDTLHLLRSGSNVPVARGDLLRRCDLIVMPSLTMDDADALCGYIDAYCTELNVTNHLKEGSDVGNRLVNASRRGMGTALEIAQRAVALASVRRRGALSIRDFANVLAVFTSCSEENNIFLANDWTRIDFQKVAAVDFEDARNATKSSNADLEGLF